MPDDQRFRAGVDIGGTFTDLILIDDLTGGMTVGKVLTTPSDPSSAVADVLSEALGRADAPAGGVRHVIHGTTLVTNALMHGRSAVNERAHEDVELILWHRSGQVVCAVTDPGAGTPVLVQPDPFGEACRGLQMVQALSATWGWARLGDRRKAVWAAMGVPAAEAGQESRHRA